MKKHLFTLAYAVSFVIASVGLAAVNCLAQTNNPVPQPEKSSDPAVRWQFNTHG
ncbi:MAG TPA: hypothetical protein VGR81_08655 [Candidatus Acidoferrales bacterium]|nr:hypothetical protein [Candidatus Acidoferrales bacterium]